MEYSNTQWKALARVCERKVRHGRRGAVEEAEAASKKYGRHMHPYYCVVCTWWHVGGRRKKVDEIKES